MNSLEEQRAVAWKASVEAFDGDSRLAESWLNEPIKALGNEKPINLTRTANA
ncbi:DUF2384 domain-containing protein [Marinobacter sp. 1-3A]|uniref:antitoxin Xre/MbcA/ParS toxin-binding domain-containing protein n=1 Tax=Marinobacter sp. 1-3A TaxID=2582920 RepID=UPI0019064324|nr:DUF2384 domain-containing protein [Marinobacter sp. 1-3A]